MSKQCGLQQFCMSCGGAISYTAEQAGTSIFCIHCGQKNQLKSESTQSHLPPLAHSMTEGSAVNKKGEEEIYFLKNGVQPAKEPPPSVVAPTPIELPDNPTVGQLAKLDPNLVKVLELFSVYLVALDEKFSAIEQDWVDAKFGLGTSEKFIEIMSTMDWEKCFGEIHGMLIQLNPDSRLYMLTQAPKLFQELLESDGLEEQEQERLIGLVRFINESCAVNEKDNDNKCLKRS